MAEGGQKTSERLRDPAIDTLPRAYGKYKLLSHIGSGGMAEVYRASLPGAAGFEKPIVIKRLHPHYAADPRFVSLFVEEAKLAACVHHRNAVQIFELGDHPAPTAAGRELYMAMELVDGLDLKRLLRIANEQHLRLPPWFTAYVGAEVLDALIYANELCNERGRRRNIVHCDVSPENIFLSTSGEAKLGDFGVARDDTRTTADPFPGKIRGKLPYMSPEQANGEHLTHASDIFSLGVVMWECLAQRRLFKGGTRAETIARITAGPRQPPSTGFTDVPLDLDQWVLAALRPNAINRPSGRQLRDGLREVVNQLRPRAYANDIADVVEAARHPKPLQDALTSIELAREPTPDPALDLYVSYLANDTKTPLGVPAPNLDAPWSQAMEEALDAVHTPTIKCPVPTFEAPLPIEPPVAAPRLSQPRRGSASPMRPRRPAPEPDLGLSEPVAADGSYSITSTHQPLRREGSGPHAPIPAPRSRHETADILKLPPNLKNSVLRPREDSQAPSQQPATDLLWLRENGRSTRLLLEQTLEHLNAAATSPTRRRLEISADGRRWLPFGHFARLLGEAPPATTSSEHSVLHGQLLDNTLVQLFARAARTHSSGRLRLERDDGRDRLEIFFAEGRVIHVGASSLLFTAWMDVLRDLDVNRDQLLGWIHRVTLEEEPFELIMSEAMQANLSVHRRRRRMRKLLEPFGWPGGRFSFDTTQAPAWVERNHSVAVGAVLERVIARSMSGEALRKELAPMMSSVLHKVSDFQSQAARIFDRPERLDCFGDGQTLAQTLQTAGDGPALMHAHLLLKLGLLQPQR